MDVRTKEVLVSSKWTPVTSNEKSSFGHRGSTVRDVDQDENGTLSLTSVVSPLSIITSSRLGCIDIFSGMYARKGKTRGRF